MANSRSRLEEILRLLNGANVGKTAALSALKRLLLNAMSGSRARLPKRVQDILNTLDGGRGRGNLGGSLGSAPFGTSDGSAFSFRPGDPRDAPPGSIVKEIPPPGPERQPTYQPQGYPEERGNFSDEFLSPTSSNVYSFQFYRRPRDLNGILYVTFKKDRIGGLKAGKPRFAGGRRQLHGKRGEVSWHGKTNEPGATYAYFNVSPDVFRRMKGAYSKGKFVWDELRVRGTVYGHRYRYSLVVGQMMDVKGLPGGQYVPRKATPKGFVTRSVADIGTGRRSFISSTLPASTGGGGFSTRRRR